jgi:hypothetical protein
VSGNLQSFLDTSDKVQLRQLGDVRRDPRRIVLRTRFDYRIGCLYLFDAASSPLNASFQVPVMQHSFEFGIAYKFGS